MNSSTWKFYNFVLWLITKNKDWFSKFRTCVIWSYVIVHICSGLNWTKSQNLLIDLIQMNRNSSEMYKMHPPQSLPLLSYRVHVLSPKAYKWQHFKLCYSVYYIICMYVFNITSEPLTICAKTFEPDYMLENFWVWLLYYNIWTWLNVLKPLNLTIPRPLNLTITIFTILSEPNYIYYNLNLTIYTIWTWLHLV